MKKLITILYLFLFTLTNIGVSQTIDTDTIRSENPDIEFLERLTFEEINNYRVSKGLNVLEWSNELGNSTRKHSEWMGHTNKFQHARNLNNASECLFYGGHAFDNETYRFHATGYTKEWIDSPPHNDILLSNQMNIGGVGIKLEDNTRNGIYVTFQISETYPLTQGP